jgi:hypothetical protein
VHPSGVHVAQIGQVLLELRQRGRPGRRLDRSNTERFVAGSTSNSRSILAMSSGVIRPRTLTKNSPLTLARIRAAISSSVL